MARLLVLYKTPQDGGAFDRYYVEKHVPIAKRIPGLRKYEISRGAVGSPAGASNYHLIAILHFDDVAAIQAGIASREGQAAVGDLQNFATGGADIFMFETREV